MLRHALPRRGGRARAAWVHILALSVLPSREGSRAGRCVLRAEVESTYLRAWLTGIARVTLFNKRPVLRALPEPRPAASNNQKGPQHLSRPRFPGTAVTSDPQLRALQQHKPDPCHSGAQASGEGWFLPEPGGRPPSPAPRAPLPSPLGLQPLPLALEQPRGGRVQIPSHLSPIRLLPSQGPSG